MWDPSARSHENAYRFLAELPWFIEYDDSDQAIPVLDELLSNRKFAELHDDLKSIRAGHCRKQALRDFEPPTARDIVKMLDNDEVVTVEGLRQRMIHELQALQKDIYGGEFNTATRFYDAGQHKSENDSSDIIAERLSLRLTPQSITISREHQLKSEKRCDITATKVINEKRRLLVMEVKGQWHPELYEAAATQLNNRYSIHPDAEQQGIFLVIWFGQNGKVAGRKRHGIKSAKELKERIEENLPEALLGQVDVFVLDVSF